MFQRLMWTQESPASQEEEEEEAGEEDVASVERRDTLLETAPQLMLEETLAAGSVARKVTSPEIVLREWQETTDAEIVARYDEFFLFFHL